MNNGYTKPKCKPEIVYETMCWRTGSYQHTHFLTSTASIYTTTKADILAKEVGLVDLPMLQPACLNKIFKKTSNFSNIELSILPPVNEEAVSLAIEDVPIPNTRPRGIRYHTNYTIIHRIDREIYGKDRVIVHLDELRNLGGRIRPRR